MKGTEKLAMQCLRPSEASGKGKQNLHPLNHLVWSLIATLALTNREEQLLQSCDRRMLRMVCNVLLSDRITSSETLRRCGLEDILLVIRKQRLIRFGHIYRRQDQDNPLRKIMHTEAPGRRPRGRPTKTWKECLKQDVAAAGVHETAAEDRAEWSAVINRLTSSEEGTRRR